jgi:hypothetical protein
MLALQSVSLPRSGPRVTARPCPPVVLRQRRRDFEALFRSEIRSSDDSWPIRAARCSPGLPHLEPQLTTLPPTPRERDERSATNLRYGRSIGWPDPRVLRHRSPKATTTPRSRGRKIGATSPPRHAAVGPDRLHHRRSGASPICTPPGDVVLPGWTRGAPRAHRTPASTTRPRARAPQQHPRCPRLSCTAWVQPPKRSTPSARLRSVRSAGAVEGVHVAGGLIRSRSVARGRVIRAGPPHQRGEERFLLTSRPRGPPDRGRAALLRHERRPERRG